MWFLSIRINTDKSILALVLESWVLNLDLLISSAVQMEPLFFSFNKFIQLVFMKITSSGSSVTSSLFPFPLSVWVLFSLSPFHHSIITFIIDLPKYTLIVYFSKCTKIMWAPYAQWLWLISYHYPSFWTQDSWYSLVDLNKITFINGQKCQILFMSTKQPFSLLSSQQNPAFVWTPMCLSPNPFLMSEV